MHACKQWFYIALAVNTVVKKVDFVKHTFTVHSVEPSFFYVCGIQRCLQGFKCGASFSSFKTHAIRRHPNWQEQNLTVFLRRHLPLTQDQDDYFNLDLTSDPTFGTSTSIQPESDPQKVAALFLPFLPLTLNVVQVNNVANNIVHQILS